VSSKIQQPKADDTNAKCCALELLTESNRSKKR